MSLALALKYRPTTFENLIGQPAVSQTLSLALDCEHTSHAYLFSGLRGSGKTSSARIFSRCLQCESGPTSKPCGECQNCKAALENRHLDIIEMDAASSRKIDDIRDVIEQTKYRPAFGRFKIFIIDEVHMLTKEAFNALLKTLEEPPEYVKFILATTDPLKLPATILSRTQHFRFKQISPRLIIEHISHILEIEGVKYEKEALEIIARSGSGSLRDTLTLLDQAIIFCKNNITTTDVTSMLGIVNPQILHSLFDSLLHSAEFEADESLSLLQEYDCEMILDEMMVFLKERLIARDSEFSAVVMDRFFRILVDSKTLLSLNTDGGFVLLLTLLKMREALKIKDIDMMIADLEGKISNPQGTQNKQTISNASESASQHITPKQSNMSNVATSNDSQKFSELVKKIYDRDYELGECFERSVSFVDYAQGTLTWESNASSECKEALKKHFHIIKTFVDEIFGVGTKISVAKSQTNEDNTNAQSNNKDAPASDIQGDIEQKSFYDERDKEFFRQNKDIINGIEQHLGIKDVIKS
ncbi:DNA polymerase III subunit gamma/tau [Helicobacter sp. 23-1046]